MKEKLSVLIAICVVLWGAVEVASKWWVGNVNAELKQHQGALAAHDQEITAIKVRAEVESKYVTEQIGELKRLTQRIDGKVDTLIQREPRSGR